MSKKSGKDKKVGKSRVARRAAPQVTSEAALKFIRRMQKKFRKPPRTRAQKAQLQRYLAKFTDGLLKAVGRRVQSDLMLRPPQTIRRKDFEKPRPTGRASTNRSSHHKSNS